MWSYRFPAASLILESSRSASLAEILELDGEPKGLQPLMYRRRGFHLPSTVAMSPVPVAVAAEPAEDVPEVVGRGCGHETEVAVELCGDPATAWASTSKLRRSSSFW